MREVTVAVRSRPLSEEDDDAQCCITISSHDGLVLVGDEKLYKFDIAFDWITEQENVYAECISKPVSKLLSGFNSSIIIYGQTGSGVTYTMGTDIRYFEPRTMGIIPRMLRDIFLKITNERVGISFLEVTNGKLNSLIDDANGNEPIMIDDQCNILKVIEDTSIQAESQEDALSCFKKGCLHHTTSNNHHSDKSHIIFTISIKKYQQDGVAVISRMHLVEVADFKPMTSDGEDNQEKFMDIDRAICDFCNTNDKHAEQPYSVTLISQQNMLEHALKGCTDNIHYITVIACISSADKNIKETVKTLRFANHLRRGPPFPKEESSVRKGQDNPFRDKLDHLPPTPACWRRPVSFPSSEKISRPTKPPANSTNSKETCVFKIPAIPQPKSSKRQTTTNTTPVPKHSQVASSDPSFQYISSPDAIENSSAYHSFRSFCGNDGVSLSPVVDRVCNVLETSMRERLAEFEDHLIRRLRSKRLSERKENFASEDGGTAMPNPQSISMFAEFPEMGVSDTPLAVRTKSPSRYRRRSIRIQKREETKAAIALPVSGNSDNKENVERTGRKRKSPKEYLAQKQESSFQTDAHKKHVSNILKILNYGTMSSIQCLPRIGPKTAQIISTWRQLQGPFSSISDLKNVRGLPQSFYTRFTAANLLE